MSHTLFPQASGEQAFTFLSSFEWFLIYSSYYASSHFLPKVGSIKWTASI